MKGGSGGSDTNNEGNGHTGRRMTLGRRARERIKEARDPGKTGGEPSGGGVYSNVYAGCPQDPKKERKKEMGDSRSQHFMLDSRDIESVTRREGRWGFSKVYPWNGRIQP